MKRTTLVKVAITGMVIVFSLAGCGKDTTTITTPEGDVKVTTEDKNTNITSVDNKVVVSQDGKNVTYKTNEGKVEGEYNMSGNTKLPDGYPSNLVPLLDNANIVMAQKVKDEESNKDGYTVTYGINKDKQEVVSKYRDILKGSKDFAELTMAGHVLNGIKDGFQISVMVSDSMTVGKEKTSVTIGLTPYSE
jgi:hypothetical protein